MVVQWKMTKAFGVSNLVNVFIAISILGPAIVTLSLQYPVGQFIHGPFHFCNGRFEVYFDPTHPGMNFLKITAKVTKLSQGTGACVIK